MRDKYPSDISPEQFESIRALLESARRSTRPRSIDLYEVFCSMHYLLRSGCQWRMIPEEFPKWRTVHAYFAIWSEPCEGATLLEPALKNHVGATKSDHSTTRSISFRKTRCCVRLLD